jgi:hypothetical protein
MANVRGTRGGFACNLPGSRWVTCQLGKPGTVLIVLSGAAALFAFDAFSGAYSASVKKRGRGGAFPHLLLFPVLLYSSMNITVPLLRPLAFHIHGHGEELSGKEVEAKTTTRRRSSWLEESPERLASPENLWPGAA